MSEPRKFSSLLTAPGAPQRDPAGRPRHCSRCLRLSEEYERHDPSWAPPEAASYVKEGVVYWLGNCESCNQLEFDAKLLKRLGAVGSPNESGITERERERREAETAKLHRERAMYAEGRKARGRGPGEAALLTRVVEHSPSPTPTPARSTPGPAITSGTHGMESAKDAQNTPMPRGQHRDHVPSVPSGPPDYKCPVCGQPGELFEDRVVHRESESSGRVCLLKKDYAMLRAEPGANFADWWERQ